MKSRDAALSNPVAFAPNHAAGNFDQLYANGNDAETDPAIKTADNNSPFMLGIADLGSGDCLANSYFNKIF